MANTKKENKLTDMTPEQRKEYNKQKAEQRKTPQFFVESANKRTNSAIKAIERISYLSKYNGTEEQTEKIIVAVQSAVDKMTMTLRKQKSNEDFRL